MANDSYTRDVASRGLAAVRDRRQASQYGINNNVDALNYLMQSGYSARQPNAMYQQWHDSRGFTPGQYGISYGRSDGDYAGYRTQSDMWRANTGIAEMLRAQDRDKASALEELAQKYLDQTQGIYQDQMARARPQASAQAIGQDIHVQGEPAQHHTINVADGGYADLFRSGNQMGAAKAQGDAINAAMKPTTDKMNDWLGKTSSPYLDALEMAQQVQTTPLRDYAQIAGAQLGIAPELIAGKYPEDTIVSDFRDQQDLAALQNYGLPSQNEYEQLLAAQERQASEADGLDQQAADQQVNDYIYQVMGVDGTQAAQRLDMTPGQLATELDNPVYQNAAAEMQSIIEDSAGDPQEIADALQDSPIVSVIYQDPVIGNILRYQFSDYIDLLDG